MDRMEGYCHVDWLWWEVDETHLHSYPVASLGIRSSEPFICMTSESIHPCIRIWDITVAKFVIYYLVQTHEQFTWSCTAIVSSTTILVIHTVFGINQFPHAPWSSYNCNYSFWYWLTGSTTIRSHCWVGTKSCVSYGRLIPTVRYTWISSNSTTRADDGRSG